MRKKVGTSLNSKKTQNKKKLEKIKQKYRQRQRDRIQTQKFLEEIPFNKILQLASNIKEDSQKDRTTKVKDKTSKEKKPNTYR